MSDTSRARDVQGQEELRVKVAELCPCIKCFESQGWFWFDGRQWTPCAFNDPCRDLNACHEFEKLLTTKELRVQYTLNLDGVCGDDGSIISATAEQRCRAFIKTMDPSSSPSGTDRSKTETDLEP